LSELSGKEEGVELVREGKLPLSVSYTLGEEIANSVTHGLGALASIAGLVLLLLRAARGDNVWMWTSFIIYGTSLILLHLASTLYHALPYPRAKIVFRVIDHGSIYILIAGTYTPFTLVSLHGSWGWGLFATVWALALAGVVYKSFFLSRFPKMGATTYILMGWLSVVAIPKLFASIGLDGLIWVATGGLVYMLGLIFFGWKKLPYNHAIWHLFVLGGGVCHYVAVYFFVS